MQKILSNKFHYSSILLIFVLFMVSVQLRKPKLDLDIHPTEEWITAHSLITLELWDNAGGPQHYGFNLIYTYPEIGNKRITAYGGVMDVSGDSYYTSYPPFAFISAYYFTKLLGGPDTGSLRAFGLVQHFFCALLIYLIIIKLRDDRKDKPSIAGLLGASLYIFSSGALWMHGIMFFSDMGVQILILGFLYLLIKLLKGEYKREWIFLTGIGLVTFLGVYTEWLAVFLAFYSGIALLILYFVQKKKVFLKAFFVIGFSAAFSVGLTFLQYSSIAGSDVLIEASKLKYEQRSGTFESVEGGQNYNWENPESFALLKNHVDRNWAMAINVFGVIFCLLIPPLVWRKSRQRMKKLNWKILIVGLLLISVLTHYLAFYNFNSIHNFSNLKTGLFMILTIAVVASIIEESLDWRFNLAFAGILLFVVIPRSIRDFERFDNFYSADNMRLERYQSADMVNELQKPDAVIMTNMFVTPEYSYRAKRNVFMCDSMYIDDLLVNLQRETVQYYYHKDDTLKRVDEYKLIDDSLHLTNQIYVDLP